MKKSSLLLVSFFLYIQCGQHQEPPQEKAIWMHLGLDAENKVLLQRAMNEGDPLAYNKVARYCILHNRYREFYCYALAMANRYQCAEAYYHLSYFLTLDVVIDGIDLQKRDPITDSLATYYLLKSHELGYKYAQYRLEPFKGNVPTSQEYFAKMTRL